MTKSKGHTIYKNKEGVTVSGVTSVIGQLAKPALAPAANKLGLQGIDSTKHWKELAEIGSLAHAMILAELKGEKLDTSDYSPNQLDKATNSMLSYLEWAKGHKVEPILLETPLVSEEFQFGGTLDFFGILDGKTTLVDYKTGRIWFEHYLQMCAYRWLLIEKGYLAPEQIIILGIPRDENDKFQEVYIPGETYTETDTGWAIFRHLLGVHNLKKKLKVH